MDFLLPMLNHNATRLRREVAIAVPVADDAFVSMSTEAGQLG